MPFELRFRKDRFQLRLCGIITNSSAVCSFGKVFSSSDERDKLAFCCTEVGLKRRAARRPGALSKFEANEDQRSNKGNRAHNFRDRDEVNRSEVHCRYPLFMVDGAA